MVKKIILFISFLLVGFVNMNAQKFNIEIRINPSNARQLEVILRPQGINSGTFVSQIVFSIKWSESCGVTLGSLSTTAPLGTSLSRFMGEQTNGVDRYQTFSGNPSTTLSTIASSYTIATIDIAGSTTPTCSFTILQDPDNISANWYMEGVVNGSANDGLAGTVTNNANNAVIQIELLSFKAEKNAEKVALQWESVNEKGLSFYAIERSTDGRNFKVIDFEKPIAKNETQKVAYSIVDEAPDLGINYYRLQMKDLDGAVKYSKVVSVDFGSKIKAKTYPNPFSSDLSIEIDIEKNIKGDVFIDVLDMTGKVVQAKKMVVEGRRVSFNLQTDDLSSGTYLIRMKNGNDTWQQKITKQ